MKSWIALIVAGLLEAAWAYYMKRSQGFTLLAPSLLCALFMALSVGLLCYAMKELPVGVAYAAWTGMGAAGAMILGMTLLGEAVTPLRLAGTACILAGVLMLKWSAPAAP